MRNFTQGLDNLYLIPKLTSLLNGRSPTNYLLLSFLVLLSLNDSFLDSAAAKVSNLITESPQREWRGNFLKT